MMKGEFGIFGITALPIKCIRGANLKKISVRKGLDTIAQNAGGQYLLDIFATIARKG
jgi:hypothetical protein